MEQLKTQITNVFDVKAEQVFHSTGSMHTKEDVLRIINSLQEECLKAINELQVPQSNNGYTIEDITNVFENLEFSDYASIDKDSAEMSMGWNNQVELESADIDWDTDTLLTELIDGLKELTAQAEGVEETIIIEN